VLKFLVNWLRTIGYCEGVSFLVLLGVAMPLKYFADMPLPTRIIGSIHGVLWLLYVAAILQARVVFKWSARRVLAGLAASVLPFGPFVFDASLRREAAQQA
jgi:integral membrane protein